MAIKATGERSRRYHLVFYSFLSQTERRKLGGSDFLEMQFCRIPFTMKIEKTVAVDNITHWMDDSLYVNGDDANLFLKEYGSIFDCGIYNNLESGVVDPFGINYYKPQFIETIFARILAAKPTDYEKLIEWLSTAKKYNGFYILGV